MKRLVGRRWMTYEEMKALPPGHTDRKLYSADISAEYSDCAAIEVEWVKHFRKKLPRFNDRQALAFCNRLCESLGERLVNKVVINSKDVKAGTAAHYTGRGREIHFPHEWISFTILIHELTHHFTPSGHFHGKDFCDNERLLFAAAYTEVTGKQPKSDW